MYASWNLTIITFHKQKPVSSPSFGKDSDNEVATELLTAVVDVTFMPHNNSEIS